MSNADRLIRIVNDILDMSKIEAGEMMVAPKRTPLQPIVEDSVRSVEGFARDSGVTITHSADGIQDVMADPDRTIQVLVNLLSNAVKHAPSGSTGGSQRRPRRRHGWRSSIRDHGPGIPSHKVDFIFEPFTQLDGSDTAPHCRHRPRPDDRARAGRETGRHHSRVVARRTGRDLYADDADCVTK